jgi:16S rRNA (cytidine1402-2'-O)-methyltransferase
VKGILYIVSTPIGNLEDITARALRILGEVDVIAAEDTRHSLKLLNHYGISKPMISYWREKEKGRTEEIMKKLNAGQSVALISDAGTPGISDPGSVLIKKAVEENIRIIPIPGPSAFLAALSVSGLSSDEFTFIGFLPSKKNRRQSVLQELSLEQRTLVFYEAPHRVRDVLMEMELIFKERTAVLIKEITKMHEEVLRGTIPEIRMQLEQSTIAGEYVLIVEGRKTERAFTTADVIPEINYLMKKGFGRKEAAKKIAEAYGLSKKELYDKSLNESVDEIS